MTEVVARLVEVKGTRATVQLLYGPRRTLMLAVGLEEQCRSAVGREVVLTVHDATLEGCSSAAPSGDAA